jgi:hypothetical protein
MWQRYKNSKKKIGLKGDLSSKKNTGINIFKRKVKNFKKL